MKFYAEVHSDDEVCGYAEFAGELVVDEDKAIKAAFDELAEKLKIELAKQFATKIPDFTGKVEEEYDLSTVNFVADYLQDEEGNDITDNFNEYELVEE